jgi:hypothetical protein
MIVNCQVQRSMRNDLFRPSKRIVDFCALTVMNVNSNLILDVTPYSMVEIYRRSSETSVNSYRTTRYQIAEDDTLHPEAILKMGSYAAKPEFHIAKQVTSKLS